MPVSKKQKLILTCSSPSFADLGVYELAHILGYLPPTEIMCARINKNMRDAAKITVVPLTQLYVHNFRKYNAMRAMATALPNLQQIRLSELKFPRMISGEFQLGHKYRDGEEPDDPHGHWATYYDNRIENTPDVQIISSFRKLRSLEIYRAPLNGRYPSLFDFPLHQKFTISGSYSLKWDLEMLSGFPLLKEFHVCDNDDFYPTTGDIKSLRALKDTLEVVVINGCDNVEGNFMDLADFPRLKELYMFQTSVIGDVRDIGDCDFLALERLHLPDSVYCGHGYEFQRIADAPSIISALYSLKKQRPNVLDEYWYGMLSENSPDWYRGTDAHADYGQSFAPLQIEFVQAGPRVGYRWHTSFTGHPCEVIWLDPEPNKESDDYEKYAEELRTIQEEVDLYRGYHQPPNEDEYMRLLEAQEGLE